jgi:general L-amino acid transport system ATP-binding protein
MSTAAAVEFERVSKQYGAFQALRDVSLTVRQGECVVICGPSGSGKSTLIRCINRLEAHDAGTIRIEGEELTERAAAKLRLRTGMVFQQFNLFPHMTVLENCILAQHLVLKRTRAESESVARKALETVRIADQAEKFPGQLSGGQQQRAAIARCLSMNPSILLFDEPTSALDPEMIREVIEVVTTLAREGRTMICVTHEMGFARHVADRIIFMDRGALVEDATPQAFFTRPQSERARDFLSQLLPAG